MNEDFCNEIYFKYRENKLAHAYLIETNNINSTYCKLLELCKKIQCEEKYNECCSKCNICNLIDLNNHPNVFTVEPDGINIKKEQVVSLKEKFSTMPVYSKYNIYIIKGAEKLNESSENSLLKFLEEPEKNILGFLLTENKEKLLSTIVSRCQCYRHLIQLDNMIDEDIEKLANQYYELMNINNICLLLANKSSSVLLKEKEKLSMFLNSLLMKYLEVFKMSLSIINLKRVDILKKYIENLKYNVNIELLLDKLVIEMSELNDEYL